MGTATCVGTASTLYCIPCTVVLYFILYAVHCRYRHMHCHRFILCVMHCGYCHMHGYCHHFILCMLCTADIVIWGGTAITLFCMLCTGYSDMLGYYHCFVLYAICNASTVNMCTYCHCFIYLCPLWYMIVCCVLSAAEHLQALPLVYILYACTATSSPLIGLPHAWSCHRYIILYASGTAQLRCGTLS